MLRLLDHSRFYWYFFSRICKDRMAAHPTGPKGGRRSIPLRISCRSSQSISGRFLFSACELQESQFLRDTIAEARP
jgi:hypothetical protein